jgi:hypothetical protein
MQKNKNNLRSQQDNKAELKGKAEPLERLSDHFALEAFATLRKSVPFVLLMKNREI